MDPLKIFVEFNYISWTCCKSSLNTSAVNKRLPSTVHHMVNIGFWAQALVKVKDFPKIEVKPKWHTKPTNDKLPKEWLLNGIWHKKVIPALFYWAGTQENPWILSDEKITDALAKIYDAYFGNTTEYTMTFNCEAVCIVSILYLQPCYFNT